MRNSAAALLVILLAGSALAGSQLVLTDGRVLDGVEVRRQGDEYLLTMQSGETVSIPIELVAQVRLASTQEEEQKKREEEEEQKTRFDPRTGIHYRAESITLAGEAKPPPGVQVGKPQVLAGEQVKPPKTSEQLKVLGEPSKFSKNVIDPEWQPKSDWNMDPSEQNNWNPSKWSKGPVDPEWQPKSDWNTDPHEQNNWNPSQWSKGSIDSNWVPQDGFKK